MKLTLKEGLNDFELPFRYQLNKVSIPGWEFKTNCEFQIARMLDQHVCSMCKYTKAEFDKEAEYHDSEEIVEVLSDNQNPMTFCDFLPENWKNLTPLERIDLLLQSACGCEFEFIDNE